MSQPDVLFTNPIYFPVPPEVLETANHPSAGAVYVEPLAPSVKFIYWADGSEYDCNLLNRRM